MHSARITTALVGPLPELSSECAQPKGIILSTNNSWKKLQKIIRERDDDVCQYCGVDVDDESFCIDHIQPKNLGGGDDEGNLRLSCFSCNSSKRKLNVEEFRELVGFQNTKYHGLITLRQYKSLCAIGENLQPIRKVLFYFEGK